MVESKGWKWEIVEEDKSMECILCRNVISHTDTKGVQQVISEIMRRTKSELERAHGF